MLTLRRYEYLCLIASGPDWNSVTQIMGATGNNRIAVHEMVRDLAADGHIRRRKRGNLVEVKVSLKGSAAIREFFGDVEHLYRMQADGKSRVGKPRSARPKSGATKSRATKPDNGNADGRIRDVGGV